jgi:hypothetical protein
MSKIPKVSGIGQIAGKRRWPAIPSPSGDIASINATTEALKQRAAIQARETKSFANSFVSIQDLVDIGLISSEGRPLFASKTTVIANFAYAAYGGMRLDGIRAGADLGAAWQTLEFNALSVENPRNVTANLIDNTLSFDSEGVYSIAISLGLTHDEINAGRLFQLRLFSVTDAVQVTEAVSVPTGRNVSATTFSIVLLIRIEPVEVNDQIRLEVGNGDAYSSVVWETSDFNVWSVGRYRGIL